MFGIEQMDERIAERKAQRDAMEIRPVPHELSHPSVIVLDTETTGLSAKRDHLLTIGVCDTDGNEVLYAEVCPPLECDSWPEAERVNGISPQDVLDKPFIDDVREELQAVLDAASEIVCYNAGFDLPFLEENGFTVPEKVTDVMIDFAEVYGEWNDHYGDYKWQKLSTCAAYYGCPDFAAHNSLADAQATAWCYARMVGCKDGGCDLEREARDMREASHGAAHQAAQVKETGRASADSPTVVVLDVFR